MHRVEAEATKTLETMWLWLDGHSQRVCNTAKRAWRLYRTMRGLPDQRCSGHTLRAIAGHFALRNGTAVLAVRSRVGRQFADRNQHDVGCFAPACSASSSLLGPWF